MDAKYLLCGAEKGVCSAIMTLSDENTWFVTHLTGWLRRGGLAARNMHVGKWVIILGLMLANMVVNVSTH